MEQRYAVREEVVRVSRVRHEERPDEDRSFRVSLSGTSVSTLACKVATLPKYAYAPQRFRQHVPLEKLDVKSQEAIVMEDLLYVMMGCEGHYVRFSDSYDPTIQFDRLKGPEFRISKSLDPSLKDLARSIVDTTRYSLALKAFIDSQSRDGFGLVNQAMCASIRKLLNDYGLLVAQLERQVFYNKNFTLHTMNVQLGSIATLLRHCYDLAQIVLKENDRKSEQAANMFSDFDKVLENLKDGKDLNELGMAVSSTRSAVCKGGSLLRILAERLNTHSGDIQARKFLEQLLWDASKPYLRMFNLWIHRGIIDDPHDEFLIQELKSSKRDPRNNQAQKQGKYTDEYWEKRYTIRKDDLPLQLSSPEIYEKVLLAGKYLNVVRECSGHDAGTDIEEQFDSIEDTRIVLSLNSAYHHANSSLLSLLIKTHELPARLRSLKHYFFLDRADFFISFMDIAEKELCKSSRKASITKLQYLLDMSLRQPGSISATDPFKDEVQVDLTHTSVTDYLLKIVNVSGMDPNDALGLGSNSNPEIVEKMIAAAKATGSASGSDKKQSSKHFSAAMGLQLDFAIPFPLSLVLSRKTILRYQLLFRHLVELKNIERTFNNSWCDTMKSPAWRHQSEIARLNAWKRKATNLRVRMLLFVQQVLYFCTMEVIEPNWSKLETSLERAKTVDSLIEQHVYYLDTCMKECMLTNQKLLKLQAKLFMACRMFGEFLLQRSKTLIQIDPTALPERERHTVKRVVDKNGEQLSPEELLTWLESTLQQYENSFDHHLKVLMEAINYFAATETTVLLSLGALLEVCM
ncbi:spindle pole body component Spc97p [Trichomonascus vanleenenianus]|uniref:gamma-tubulin-complex subunit SPC97 n=1 Tax=Trichomonascus vanleenenianus TaxID=2268995 RepID=UPI003ECA47A5